MSGRTIEKIAYALEKQDNSWLSLLSSMTTREILDARYETEDTVLSLLVSATILFPRKNSKIFGTLSQVCRSVYKKINTHIETPVVGYLLEMMGRLFTAPKQENATDCSESKKIEDSVLKLSTTFPDITEGIHILAKKFEATRSSYRWDRIRHEEFCRKVEGFLQLENVEYIFSGKDAEVHCKKSCTYTMSLQYFFYTSCPEIQAILLDPIRALFVGFSRYSVDVRGARPIHYALSMCGGICEEEFYRSILSCLLNEEEERCSRLELKDADTRDKEGNTLLQYALSSVYCSPKVLHEVISRFGKVTSDRSRRSITEMLIENIPYYALFFSLECMNSTRKDTLSDANKNLRESMQGGELPEIRKAVAKLALEKKSVHDSVLNLSSVYEAVLGVVYGIDEKICTLSDSVVYERSTHIENIIGLLHDYRKLLDDMCADSDIESDERDDFTSRHMEEIFNCGKKEHNPIGARVAAEEVMGVMLQNPKYIRKASITAGYARNARILAERGNGSGNVSAWIYDTYSLRINRFFAAMALLGKKSSFLLEGHLRVLNDTRDAIKYCKSNKNLCIATIYMLVVISLALLSGAVAAIYHLVLLELHFKIGVALIACTLGGISVVTGYLYCRNVKQKTANDIEAMVKDFDVFTSRSARNSADLLNCANPYVDVTQLTECAQRKEVVQRRKAVVRTYKSVRGCNMPTDSKSVAHRARSLFDVRKGASTRTHVENISQERSRDNEKPAPRDMYRARSLLNLAKGANIRTHRENILQERSRDNEKPAPRDMYRARSLLNLAKGANIRTHRENILQERSRDNEKPAPRDMYRARSLLDLAKGANIGTHRENILQERSRDNEKPAPRDMYRARSLLDLAKGANIGTHVENVPKKGAVHFG